MILSIDSQIFFHWSSSSRWETKYWGILKFMYIFQFNFLLKLLCWWYILYDYYYYSIIWMQSIILTSGLWLLDPTVCHEQPHLAPASHAPRNEHFLGDKRMIKKSQQINFTGIVSINPYKNIILQRHTKKNCSLFTNLQSFGGLFNWGNNGLYRKSNISDVLADLRDF